MISNKTMIAQVKMRVIMKVKALKREIQIPPLKS
jgi:hypothetical protein